MSSPTPSPAAAGRPSPSSGAERVGSAVAGDAEGVAATVRALPGVADLWSGGPVPLATYLPGRRVTGVRLDEDAVRVAVVAAAGTSVPSVAGQVRAALAEVARGRRVDVHVGDVRLPGEDERPDEPAALPPAPQDAAGAREGTGPAAPTA